MSRAGARRRADRAFFRGETCAVARRLIGAWLVHERDGLRRTGRIVEVEAYLARADAASHSHRGPSERNASMFLERGHAYVYRIYGVHHCFNVVTAAAGVGEAVLVRALEPLEGLDEMRRARSRHAPEELCDGPGKLVQALGIGPEHDGLDLVEGPIRLELEPGPPPLILCGPRIGISKARELPLRFSLAGSPWLSRRGGERTGPQGRAGARRG